jgi:WD40-like Beta Propeller Repeat
MLPLRSTPAVSRARAAALVLLLLGGVTQAATGNAPQVFAPGVISGPDHDTAPAFTPDGRTVYFSRSDDKGSRILVAQRTAEVWSQPVTASFSGQWNDMEPAMAPDGSYLVFASNRPAHAGEAPLNGFFMGKAFPGRGGNLWRVERRAAGWSEPQRLPDSVNGNDSTFAPAVAADGTLYFMHPDAAGRRFHLFSARKLGASYATALALSFSADEITDCDPAVAADQSFMVFASSRPPARQLELFIVFRSAGGWGTPQHLDGGIEGPGSNAEARLGPDQRTLYFSSERLAADAPAGATWNNGKYNIWHVSLAPWLATAGR